MTSVRCWRQAALLSAPLVLAGLLLIPARPADAQDVVAEDGGQIAAVAKTSVKRSWRRSRRPAARRSAALPAKPDVAPIPRPKPGSAAAAASAEPDAAAPSLPGGDAPDSQTASRPSPLTPVLPQNPAAARAELRALYAVNALSYRCNFELTTREGAMLDHAVSALETQLKLDTQAADALFSDVDLTLYGNGGNKICAKGGPQARAFRATLDRLLGE